MLSDPIADMLTRIRNAYQGGHQSVRVPYSGFKEKVLRVLLKNNYLQQVKKERKELVIKLRYEKEKPALTKIKRISKPSLRIYKRADKLPYVLSGLGMAVISTSKGVMTGREARKKGLGGEVICEIW